MPRVSPKRATTVPRVLSIAGSDCCGGAGIQADIKVITCLGGYAMSAVTAVTAQDTLGVWGIYPLPPDFVAQQVELCISDIGVDSVKTGMFCNAAIVRAVADVLRRHRVQHLVVDPVMFSKSGHRLLDREAQEAVISEILPLAHVVTPNLPEASCLAGFQVKNAQDMRRAAEVILQLGPEAVVIKGGHLRGASNDLLYDGRNFLELPSDRIKTKNTHGTGCSFASALATELACGRPLPQSFMRAKRFITEAIRFSLPLGKGSGPTNPLAAAMHMRPPPK